MDFIAASGHKMAGPSGVGFLWAKASILESMPPWQFGGEMIDQVYLDHSTFAPPPLRFEPGTPAIEQVVGLGAAVDYLNSIGGMHRVHEFEKDLGTYLYEQLARVEDVVIYGPPPDVGLGRAGLAAFNIEGLHATDISMLLDAAGAHCWTLLRACLWVCWFSSWCFAMWCQHALMAGWPDMLRHLAGPADSAVGQSFACADV